ncbi:MAG: fimbrillin family protein [Bacteroidia bacterium]|nr:fimbrillin family protein [Bacteroidia bacterium]
MFLRQISFAFATLSLASLLVGCTKDSAELKGSGCAALELAAVNSSQTKAVIDGTTFPQEGHIGLFLFKEEAATTPYGESGYANVDYSYNSEKSKWTSSQSVLVGNVPGYLYGYYPYSGTATNIKAIPVASSLNGDDVMYASKQANPITDENAASTAITMNHALARVSITVKNNGYTGEAKLTSIKFAGAETSINGTLDATSGAISGTTKADVSLTVQEANQQITAEGAVYECLLVPSALTDSKQEVSITFTIDGEEKTAILSGDNGVIIAQNTKSKITITLSNTGISVSTVSIDKWNEVEVGGHKVKVVLGENDGIEKDVLMTAYTEGETAKIIASSMADKILVCRLSGDAECVRSKSDGIYTFTVSNITSDITAAVDYAKSITITTNVSPDGAGSINIDGFCYEEETVILTASPSLDCYTFTEWHDINGNKLDWSNPQEITLSSDFTINALFEDNSILSGVFSVSAGKQVRFSKGNLYYTGANFSGWTLKDYDAANWRFEINQYDTTPSGDAYRDDNHISHFLWCNNAKNSLEYFYKNDWDERDVDLFTNSQDFEVYGRKEWRALSGGDAGEWKYLLDTRAMEHVNFRYTNISTTGVTIGDTEYKGLFIYPDDYDGNQVGDTGGPDTWDEINAKGIVFLPDAGYRDAKETSSTARDVTGVGFDGLYWASNGQIEDMAFCLNIYISGLDTELSVKRNQAQSIRLVIDANQ